MAVVEQRSFTNAAKQRGVTQPALSWHIAQLEEDLKIKLFDRSRTGAVATVFGKTLYEQLLPIVRDLTALPDRIADLAHLGPSGSVRVGLTPAFNNSVLSGVLHKFLVRYPGVTVEVREGLSGTLTHDVAMGLIDFAMGAWNPDTPGLRVEFAYEEDLFLISGKPIAGASGSPCRLDEIDDLHLCTTAEENVLGKLIRSYIRRGDIVPARVVTLNGLASSTGVVRGSCWAAISPKSVVNKLLLDDRYWIYPIEFPLISYQVYGVSNSKVPLSRATALFRDMIVQAIGEWDCGRLSVRES